MTVIPAVPSTTSDLIPENGDFEFRFKRAPSFEDVSVFEGCMSSAESSDEDRAASPEPSVCAAIVEFVSEVADTVAVVHHEELDARICIFSHLQALIRQEVERLQRVSRDELYKSRAAYFRTILVSAPHRGYGPSVWPRHAYLPAALTYPTRDYKPEAPATRSCIRVLCDMAIAEPSKPRSSSRRVRITDDITVQAGQELVETDGELASAQWRAISLYAPVRHMVMTSLKTKFGCDASDPHGWMSLTEDFSWLDDIFCGVKDVYQHLHNEESAAWARILEHDRIARHSSPMWWARLSSLVWA